MQIRFYLHSKTLPGGRRAIYCQYSHQGGRWRFSTGLAARYSEWMKRKQRLNTKARMPAHKNRLLDAVEERVLLAAYMLKEKGIEPGTEAVRAAYLAQGGGLSFWAAYDKYFSEYISNLAGNTQKHHRNVYRHLQSFEIWDAKPLTWQGLDPGFVARFRAYLSSRGNSENTIRRKLKNIKAFLKYAEDASWVNLSARYQAWSSTPVNEGKEEVYLTEEEMQQIKEVILPERLDKVRDLFLFQFGTGMRFSEVRETTRSGKLLEGILHFYEPKNKRDRRIKLGQTALQVWNKYRGNLPAISNQKYNKYIKEIARDAGIFKGVMYKGDVVPKYSIITTHTARRSFITLLLKKGVPINDVSKIVGHSDLKITAHYDKKTEAEIWEVLEGV